MNNTLDMIYKRNKIDSKYHKDIYQKLLDIDGVHLPLIDRNALESKVLKWYHLLQYK